MRAEGRTVLLSTHDLEEAAQLCDRVAIMDGGRIIAVAPPAELIGRATSPSRVIVRTAPPLASAVVNSLPDVLGAVYRDGGWILETRAPNRLLADLVRRADEAGAELLDFRIAPAFVGGCLHRTHGPLLVWRRIAGGRLVTAAREFGMAGFAISCSRSI